MNDESISDDLDRFGQVYGDLDLTVLETDNWYPVFVYGTMCHQGRNEHRLRERKDAYARYVSITSTKGNAFHLRARKTGHGYLAPVAQLGGESSIAGELWEVRHTVLLELDMFEGHPTVYRREMIPMACDREAWMYLYQGDIRELSDYGVYAQNRIFPVMDPITRKWITGNQDTLGWWVGA